MREWDLDLWGENTCCTGMRTRTHVNAESGDVYTCTPALQGIESGDVYTCNPGITGNNDDVYTCNPTTGNRD